MRQVVLALSLLFLSRLPLTAQVSYVWNGGPGNWTTSSNWTPNGIPGVSDTAIISSGGTYIVTLDANAVVARMVIGGASGTQKLLLSSRDLTINGLLDIRAGGLCSLRTNATISGTGNIRVRGRMTLDNSSINVATTIDTTGSMQVLKACSLSGGFSNAGFLQLVGSYFFANDAVLTIATGFTNTGTIQLYSDHSGTSIAFARLDVTSGSLVNTGTIQSTGTDIDWRNYLGAALVNQGNLVVGNRFLEIDKAGAAHSNSGTITIAPTKTLSWIQSGTGAMLAHSGNLQIDSAATMLVRGGAFDFQGGVVDNRGTLELTEGVTATLTASYVNQATGTLTIRNSTCNGGGTLTNQGVFFLNNSTINPGVTNVPGATLQARRSSSFTGSFSNEGFLQIVGSYFGGSDALLTITDGFTNGGTIQFYSDHSGTSLAHARLDITNGFLLNTGTIQSTGTDIEWTNRLNAELRNQGTIVITNRPLEVNKPGASHSNAGTIRVAGVNKWLQINQSATSPLFDNSGVIEIDSAATFRVNNGALVNGSAGLIRGDGILYVQTTTFTNAGTVSPGDSIGPLTVTGNLPQNSSALLSMQIAGPAQHDQLLVSGAVMLGGTLRVDAVEGYLPAVGDSFLVMTFGSRSGMLESVVGSGSGVSIVWDTVFASNSLYVRVSAITDVEEDDRTMAGLPVSYALHQNYPNPFNPSTRIRFSLPQESHVRLRIANLLGQEIATLVDGRQPAGYHEVVWDGMSASGAAAGSGVYFYMLEARTSDSNGTFIGTKKMILVR